MPGRLPRPTGFPARDRRRRRARGFEGQPRAGLRPGQGHVGDLRPGLAGAVDPLAGHGLRQDRRPSLALEGPVVLLVPLDLADHLVQGDVNGLLARLVGHPALHLGQEHRGQERVDVGPELHLDARPAHARDGQRLGVGLVHLRANVVDALDDRAAIRPLARGVARADQGQRGDAGVGHVRRVAERGMFAIVAHIGRLLALAPAAARELVLHQPVEALLHVAAQRLGLDGRRPGLRTRIGPRLGLRGHGLLLPPGLILDPRESDSRHSPGDETPKRYDHRHELPSTSHETASSGSVGRFRPTRSLRRIRRPRGSSERDRGPISFDAAARHLLAGVPEIVARRPVCEGRPPRRDCPAPRDSHLPKGVCAPQRGLRSPKGSAPLDSPRARVGAGPGPRRSRPAGPIRSGDAPGRAGGETRKRHRLPPCLRFAF